MANEGRAAGRRLLRWYRRHGRDLPWRRDPDPYRVLVSEVMLQQTTVGVAGPYFLRFMRKWPTLERLARAREEDLLAAWSGLGYYHRARNLLRAARLIARRHAGRVPADVDALRALPGVGAYTAGAVLSIGHNLPRAALDGNAMRVAARLGGVRGDPARAEARRVIERLVLGMMPEREASAFNQALMDLGAMVCTPRAPRCGECPLASGCAARRLGAAAAIPPPKRTAAAEAVDLAAVVVRRGEACLLVRRDGGALMRGLWEFPIAPARSDGGARDLARRLGARLTARVGEVRHTITRHRMRVVVFEAAPPSRGRSARPRAASVSVRASEPGGGLATSWGAPAARWERLERIASGHDLALTGTALKIARLLGASRPSRERRRGGAEPAP